MGRAAFLGVAMLAAMPPAMAEPAQAQLNTIADVGKALKGCWKWPPLSESRAGMEFTVRLSFKRNGEVFGARITYQTPHVSDEERSLYYGALLAALSRCSPLPLSDSLGSAIAGRPLYFHIRDTRQQRKA